MNGVRVDGASGAPQVMAPERVAEDAKTLARTAIELLGER